MNYSIPVAVSLLALVGCSGDPDAPNYDAAGFRGDVQLRACNADAEQPLVRCGGDAAPGIIAAVCGDLEADNTVTLSGGSLAVSGHTRLAAPLHVNLGSFTGFGGIQADNTQDVSGDLATAGDWVVSSPAHVGGDAFVGGALDARNQVDVGGVLHVAGADMKNVTARDVTTTGTTVTSPLHCNAAPDSQPKIAHIEAGGVVDLGHALVKHSQPATVELGCARYRFASLGIENNLDLHVTGNTVIVVDGDMRIAAPMRVLLDEDAQLDFLVGGALEVDNQLTFSGGSTWLAVAGELRIASPMKLVGFLYAPQSAVSSASSVSADNTLDVLGSLLVDSVRVASPITVTAMEQPALPACPPSEQQ